MLSRGSEEIRVVLLVDEGDLRLWQEWCLDEIRKISQVELVGIVSNNSGVTRNNFLRKAKHKALPSAMKMTVSPPWLLRLPSFECDDVRSGQRYHFERKCLDWIKGLNPTLIIRFGFGFIEGEILDIADEGVWSFHHGDIEQYRGRPPAFWEFLKNEKRIGITLQRLNNVLDGGEMLDRGFVALTPGSPRKTLQKLYACGPLLLRRTLLRLLYSGSSQSIVPNRLGKLYRTPKLAEVAKFIFRVSLGFFKWVMEKSFLEHRWKIGIADVDRKFSGNYSLCPIWLNGPSRGFYADPGSSEAYPGVVFLEHYENKRSKGRIVAVTLDANAGETGDAIEVLDLSKHVSFPQVYSIDGEKWLIPETASYGKQLAFKLSSGLKVINPDMPLEIRGLSGVDPVIFFHEEVWWALTSPGGESGSHLLNLFHSESLLGPYAPHIANPVVIDPSGARPAGPICSVDGKILRFGQVFGRRYGEGINVFEVKTINKQVYQEEQIATIRLCKRSKRPVGIHGITVGSDSVVVDGYELGFSILAGLRRIRNRARS